jgi:hypothetical protein
MSVCRAARVLLVLAVMTVAPGLGNATEPGPTEPKADGLKVGGESGPPDAAWFAATLKGCAPNLNLGAVKKIIASGGGGGVHLAWEVMFTKRNKRVLFFGSEVVNFSWRAGCRRQAA